jgi:GTPase SAR1 family protein
MTTTSLHHKCQMSFDGTCSTQENLQQKTWVLIPNACNKYLQQHEENIHKSCTTCTIEAHYLDVICMCLIETSFESLMNKRN